MKIKLTTKFNVGDAVYITEHYNEFYASKDPWTITDIFIQINKYKTNILYWIKKGNCTDKIQEDWLFATYEECTKWCEDHN